MRSSKRLYKSMRLNWKEKRKFRRIKGRGEVRSFEKVRRKWMKKSPKWMTKKGENAQRTRKILCTEKKPMRGKETRYKRNPCDFLDDGENTKKRKLLMLLKTRQKEYNETNTCRVLKMQQNGLFKFNIPFNCHIYIWLDLIICKYFIAWDAFAYLCAY